MAWYEGSVGVGAPEGGAGQVGPVEGISDQQVDQVDHLHVRRRIVDDSRRRRGNEKEEGRHHVWSAKSVQLVSVQVVV